MLGEDDQEKEIQRTLEEMLQLNNTIKISTSNEIQRIIRKELHAKKKPQVMI
jgi:hypothetical protein